MASCCLICYRVSEGLPEGHDREKLEELQKRFYRLFNRYLNEGDENEKLPFKLDPLAGMGALACSQCSILMGSFCEMYHQLKSIELILNWKAEKLKNIMICAQAVPSRINCVRKFIERAQLDTINYGKGADQIIKSIVNSRKALIGQCSQKLGTTFPKLPLLKWKGQQKESSKSVISPEFQQQCEDDPPETISTNIERPPSTNANQILSSYDDRSSPEIDVGQIKVDRLSANFTIQNEEEDEGHLSTSLITTKVNQSLSQSNQYSDIDHPSNPISNIKEETALVKPASEVPGDEEHQEGSEGDASSNIQTSEPNPDSETGDCPSEPPTCISDSGQVPCPVANCDGNFNPDALQSHQKLNGTFPCFSCNSSFDYGPDLSMHEVSVHSDPNVKGGIKNAHKSSSVFPCPRPNCAYQTGNKLKYIRHHIMKHLQLDPEGLPNVKICHICKAVLASQSISHHFATHHKLDKLKPGKGPVKCDQKDCTAYFLALAQLIAHKKEVHDLKQRFKCPDCDAAYSKPDTLLLHRRKLHRESLLHHCNFEGCSDRFDGKQGLDAHVRLKHDPKMKQLKCPQCDKTCLGEQGLDFHMKIHAPGAKKGNLCEICGKGFKRTDNLKNHYLTHSGSQSWEFMCSICSKKCVTKGKLDEHMRIHTQDKPFVCEICGVKYAHQHNLRLHVNSKHGDKVQDKPGKLDKTNFTTTKMGTKRKRRSNVESELDAEDSHSNTD